MVSLYLNCFRKIGMVSLYLRCPCILVDIKPQGFNKWIRSSLIDSFHMNLFSNAV
jgi:hypothetical protein